MNIERRLDNLERANRRYRLALSICILGIAGLAMSGFLRTAAPGHLIASSLKIVDSKGYAVIEMKPLGERAGRISIMNNSPACGVHLISNEMLTCRANLQTVANAVQALAVKSRRSQAQIWEQGISMDDLKPDLQASPICPSHGEYSFEKGVRSIRIRCSLPSHGAFEPGIDND